MLQPLDQHADPLLGASFFANPPILLEGPKLDTVFQMRHHKLQVEGIKFLDLLTPLFLMLCFMQLLLFAARAYCRYMFNLLSTCTGHSQRRCFLASWSPDCSVALSYSTPGGRISFALAELHETSLKQVLQLKVVPNFQHINLQIIHMGIWFIR